MTPSNSWTTKALGIAFSVARVAGIFAGSIRSLRRKMGSASTSRKKDDAPSTKTDPSTAK